MIRTLANPPTSLDFRESASRDIIRTCQVVDAQTFDQINDVIAANALEGWYEQPVKNQDGCYQVDPQDPTKIFACRIYKDIRIQWRDEA